MIPGQGAEMGGLRRVMGREGEGDGKRRGGLKVSG